MTETRDWRDVVRKLRAKARSTSFPAEREALLTKAMELERAHQPRMDFDAIEISDGELGIERMQRLVAEAMTLLFKEGKLRW